MRSNLVGALAWLAVACGGDDSGSATPYSNDRCGDIPAGMWNVQFSSAPRPVGADQTTDVCEAESDFTWDFAAAVYMNVYDGGCRLQSTIMHTDRPRTDELDVMWVTADKWTGTIQMEGLNNNRALCVAIADVTLTRP